MTTHELTAKTAREILDYNPETGEFFWRRCSKDYFKDDRVWKGWNKRQAEPALNKLNAVRISKSVRKNPAEFAVKQKTIKTVALAEKPMFKMLLLKQVLAHAIPNAKADYKSDRYCNNFQHGCTSSQNRNA